jgi:hypothetical protein
MPAKDTAQANFKAWDKALRERRKQITERRRDAVGILSPALLRQYTKPTAQDLVLAYGRSGATVSYSPAELQAMVRSLKKAQKLWDTTGQGAPRVQLIAASDPGRIKRANNQGEPGKGIRNAVMGKIRGNLLTFRVTASALSKSRSHEVRLRLEEWDKFLLGTKKYVKSAKKAADGRVSIQCSCEDFQYQYRYLATIGNYVVSPPKEHGYPKIKNPRLKGCCCKHILKCLSALDSLGIQRILAREMERQAQKIGFGDDKSTRFLDKEELKKATRAVKKTIDHATAKKLWKERQRQYKAFKDQEKKMEKRLVEEAEKERKQRQKAEAKAKRTKDLGQKHLVGGIKTAIEMAKDFGMSAEQGIARYAKNSGITVQQATNIAKREGLI